MRLTIDLPTEAVPTSKGEAQVRHDIYEALAFYWLARGELTAATAASLAPGAQSFKAWLSSMPDVGEDEDFERSPDSQRSEVQWDT